MPRSPYDARSAFRQPNPLEREADTRRIQVNKLEERIARLEDNVESGRCAFNRSLDRVDGDVNKLADIVDNRIGQLQDESLQLRTAIKHLVDITLPRLGYTAHWFVEQYLGGFKRTKAAAWVKRANDRAVKKVVVAAPSKEALAKMQFEMQTPGRVEINGRMGLIQFVEQVLEIPMTDAQRSLIRNYAVTRKPDCGKCQDSDCVACYPQGSFPG